MPKNASPGTCPGSNSTNTSTSLSGPKSSRRAEPKIASFRIWCCRQKSVIRSFAKVGEDAICTSIVVAGKLRCGAAKKGSPVLSDKIGQLLSTIEVLPLEEGADEKYAEVRTALERAGTLIGANDLLIATRA